MKTDASMYATSSSLTSALPSRLLSTVLSRYSSTSYAVSNPTLATQEDEITLPDGEPAGSLALREFLHSEGEDPLHSP